MTKKQEQLVEDHLRWVKIHAHRVAMTVTLPPCLNVEDLESYGFLGLMEAAKRFDPCWGIKFETFALHRVRGSMYDGLRSADWLSRTLRKEVKNGTQPAIYHFSLDKPVFYKQGAAVFAKDLLVAPERYLPQHVAEIHDLAQVAIHKVFGRHRIVIQKHFLEHKTQAETGAEMGISESRVCQIVQEALSQMREAFGVEKGEVERC